MPTNLIAGASNFALGNYEQANSFLQRYIAWAPQNTSAKKLLASTLMKIENPGPALDLLLPIVDSETDDVDLLLLVGSAAARSGQTVAANTYYKLASDIRPDDPRLRTRLALAQIASRNNDAGIKELERTISDSPGDFTSRYSLLMNHLQNEEYQKALDVVAEIQKRDAKNIAAFIGKGLAESGMNLTSEATASFEKALEVEPGHLGAAFALADIHLKQKAFDKASQVYDTVLSIKPKSLPILMRMIGLATYRNDEVAADALIRQAMDAAPSAPEPRLLAAENLLDRGEPLRAIALLADIAPDHPDHPGILQITGKAQLAAGKGGTAVRTLEHFVKVSPQSPYAHFLLAQAYGTINSRKRMYEELDATLKLDPLNKLAAISLVRGLAIEDRQDDANQRMATLKAAMPADDPDVLSLEAWLATRQNRPGDAVPLLRTLVGTYDLREDKRQLVAALWNSGQKKDAISVQTAHVKSKPEDLAAAFELANYYLLGEQRDEAAGVYETILEKIPENVIALNNLADLLKEQDPDRALGYAELAYKQSGGSPPTAVTLAEILIKNPDTLDKGYIMIKGVARRFPSAVDAVLTYAKAASLKGETDEARTALSGIDSETLSEAQKNQVADMLKNLE